MADHPHRHRAGNDGLALRVADVGEFIGAERGIGRLIVESEARAEAAGMMVAVRVLMAIGVLLTSGIRRLQNHLLRWQGDVAG